MYGNAGDGPIRYAFLKKEAYAYPLEILVDTTNQDQEVSGDAPKADGNPPSNFVANGNYGTVLGPVFFEHVFATTTLAPGQSHRSDNCYGNPIQY